LLGLAQEIDAINASNRKLSQGGHEAAHGTLGGMGAGDIDIDEYDAHAALPDRSLLLRIVDETI
jgi:hypothetical protein